MAAIYRLTRAQERFGLAEGDILLTIPYWLDPDKVTVICRIPDGFDPECNQYREDLHKVTDSDLSEWAWKRAKEATSAQVRRAVTASGPRDVSGAGFDAHDADTARRVPNQSMPTAQAAAWAASCEALDAASAAERLAALQAVVETTVSHLERAELVTDDYQYVAVTDVGEFCVRTGNLQFTAGMTGSLDTPAAAFIVTTSDDDDPGMAMERTTRDLGAVRAWLMSWTVAALARSAAA